MSTGVDVFDPRIFARGVPEDDLRRLRDTAPFHRSRSGCGRCW